MSPTATLQRNAGTTVRACTDRIVRTWGRATADDMTAGAAWYPAAGELARDLATRGGHTLETAAAVIAHLSPRTPWGRNVAGAAVMLLTGEDPTGHLGDNVRRARRALESTDPLSTLRTHKVRSFAANILGDRDAVTVDVWAMRVALGTVDDRALRRVGTYDALAHAYRLAAARVGTDPATMQATTWVVARNGRAA